VGWDLVYIYCRKFNAEFNKLIKTVQQDVQRKLLNMSLSTYAIAKLRNS